jgi:multidrug efflux pump subunit AcrB
MWIVRLALRRPYTFVVMAMAIILLGLVAIFRMPTDIFPEVDIPVVSVIWQYPGMSPAEMESRYVRLCEGILTTTVNNIEHLESQALNGVSVTRVYFQPGAKIEEATAQVTAICQTALRQMPPGTTPPLIMRYSASTVPILQLSMGSDTLPEQTLFDISANFLRTELATVQGAMVPWPYGGKMRYIVVDLEPDKLYGYGLSAADVSNAMSQQNLILPSGTVKMGSQEYYVRINSSPEAIDAINNLPIKTVNGTTVYVKDVAHVSDKYMPQTNMVHSEGKKGALVSIYKLGNASTLDIVQRVKDALPGIKPRLPHYKDLKVTPLFDQSVFVRASIEGVVKEAAIAAGLTGLMILLFLGSWRSTLIICISIPLSILVSIICLWFLNQTLNVMTLGGMALAVGILVDDATVEIENIHRNLHQGKRLVKAILDGAQQIAIPAFVSTLCICIVFVPVVFITGPAKSLFTPLAMAVVFAMMTSYFLSRTLVPTMVHYLLESEVFLYGGVEEPGMVHDHSDRNKHVGLIASFYWALKATFVLAVAAAIVGLILLRIQSLQDYLPHWLTTLPQQFRERRNETLISIGRIVAIAILSLTIVYEIFENNWIWRTHQAFNRQFEKFRRFYGGFLALALQHRGATMSVTTLFVVGSCFLFPHVGKDFFPSVDAGQLRMHVRAPAGTRLEETERYFAGVEDYLRKAIPPKELETMLDNIGIPNSGINLSLSDGSQISPADGEILISLKENHRPTDYYMRKLRKELPQQFPGLTFFFAPSDIATQVLNFGIPAPIDVQILGTKMAEEENANVAEELRKQVAAVPGAVDVHIHQVTNTPDLRVEVDRTKAGQVGLTQRDVANDLLVSLSSSGQTSPNYWLDTKLGVQYLVAVMTPQHKVNDMTALQNTPIITPGVQDPQLLGNLSQVSRGHSESNITHYNIKPTYDIQANVQGADLGTVSTNIERIVQQFRERKKADGSAYLPPGTSITMRGQVESMNSSFEGLAFGIIGAVILVYLLMAVNFQSWLDPLIILMALPAAVAGILWILYATRTTVSVPSLMGSIMCIGVATANSILMITFANDQRRLHGMNAHDAALAAGMTRLRPVIMTALAMIIGMLPMSLGMGEGGEQNAPLGRAVIGGLSVATFATLFFVPVVYSVLRTKMPERLMEAELLDPRDFAVAVAS